VAVVVESGARLAVSLLDFLTLIGTMRKQADHQWASIA
jgi:hypothetical protein